MAIAFDIATGNTGTGTGETAALNHAANVMVILCISYLGTTSPNSFTVGGITMTLLLKASQSTNMTTEVYYLYVSGAANDTVSIGFAGATRHAWSVASWTGASSAGAGSFEGTTSATGSGISIQTATVSLAAGTSGRMALSCVGGATAVGGLGSIVIAPANSETERREDELAGSAGAIPVGSQIQEFNSSASRNMNSSLSKLFSTIQWSIIAFGLLSSSSSIPNKIIQVNQAVKRGSYY